jgi:proteic killer suppression protein
LTDVSYLLALYRDPDPQEQSPFGTVDEGEEFEDRCEMHKRIFARLDRFDVAVRAEEMNVPGFDFHPLQGFNPKRYSVHVNGPWCITFEFEDGEACRVDFEQYH